MWSSTFSSCRSYAKTLLILAGALAIASQAAAQQVTDVPGLPEETAER